MNCVIKNNFEYLLRRKTQVHKWFFKCKKQIINLKRLNRNEFIKFKCTRVGYK